MPNNDLNFAPGKQVVIRNLVTRETANFSIREVAQYRGQAVVYGVTEQHGVRVGKGTVIVKERPGCWVYVTGESPERVMDLVKKLKGSPLVILQDVQTGMINLGQTSAPTETRAHPILQAGRLPGLRGYQDGAGRDGMILKAQRLVDVYWDWREKMHYGQLPGWVNVPVGGLPK